MNGALLLTKNIASLLLGLVIGIASKAMGPVVEALMNILLTFGCLGALVFAVLYFMRIIDEYNSIVKALFRGISFFIGYIFGYFLVL